MGGPNKEDKYEDVRTDFAATEVALDWNAALTGMVAGLASERVTWDDCKSAGLQQTPGDVGPALSGALSQRQLRCCWTLLMAAVAFLLLTML